MSQVISASYSCSAELKDEKNWGYRGQRRQISEPDRNEWVNTYMAADELVLSEEAKVRWPVDREVLAEGKEVLEAIANNLQARQSAW